MGRRCGDSNSVRGRDCHLRGASGQYRHWAAAVMTWLDANAEAIILAGVMGICWMLAMVA
jgi:hypothetical protein